MKLRRDERGFAEVLETIPSAIELIQKGAEVDAWRFLIDETCLPAGFDDLKTGAAGEFIQKMQNYGIVVAAVFDPSREHAERFVEFLREARRGPQFRAFDERGQAETWLSSLS